MTSQVFSFRATPLRFHNISRDHRFLIDYKRHFIVAEASELQFSPMQMATCHYDSVILSNDNGEEFEYKLIRKNENLIEFTHEPSGWTLTIFND